MLKLFVIATAMLSGLAFNSGNNQVVKPLETEIKNIAINDNDYMESLLNESISNYPKPELGVNRLYNKYKVKFYETESFEYYGYIHYLDINLEMKYRGGVYLYKVNKETQKIIIMEKFESYDEFVDPKRETYSIPTSKIKIQEKYSFIVGTFPLKVEEKDLDFTLEESLIVDEIKDYHFYYSNFEVDVQELYPELVLSSEYENAVINEYIHANVPNEYIKINRFMYYPRGLEIDLYLKINKYYLSNEIKEISSAGMTQTTNFNYINLDMDIKYVSNNEILKEQHFASEYRASSVSGFDYSQKNIGPQLKYYSNLSIMVSASGHLTWGFDNIFSQDIKLPLEFEDSLLISPSTSSVTYGFNYDNPVLIPTYFVSESDYKKGPQILGPDKLESKYSEALTQEEIISNYHSYDLTQLENPQITIKNDSGYFNAVENEKYGTYKLTLSAIDEDDHETERVVEIELIDNSDEYLPKISGPRKVYKANNILLTIEDIKTLYKAEDEDGNTLDVEVKNLTYLDNANKVGSYKVKVTATDSKDRTRELPVTIEVLDGCSDMWYTNPTEIHTTQHSALTIEQIMHEYEWYSGNEIFYYEVLDDTYSEMSDVPGTYNIEVEITNFEKQYVEEITIHVDEAATLVTAAEQNFLYWVGRFFDWLWNDIILFFC